MLAHNKSGIAYRDGSQQPETIVNGNGRKRASNVESKCERHTGALPNDWPTSGQGGLGRLQFISLKLLNSYCKMHVGASTTSRKVAGAGENIPGSGFETTLSRWGGGGESCAAIA
jgi:hypothetical protein